MPREHGPDCNCDVCVMDGTYPDYKEDTEDIREQDPMRDS